MNKLIAILAIMLTTSVHAGTCEMLSDLSGSIMDARQAGVKMQTLLKNVANGEDKHVNWYSRHEIKRAYKEPRFSTASYQNNAILDFENEAYSICLDALDK